jgi:hypothetical protein
VVIDEPAEPDDESPDDEVVPDESLEDDEASSLDEVVPDEPDESSLDEVVAGEVVAVVDCVDASVVVSAPIEPA